MWFCFAKMAFCSSVNSYMIELNTLFWVSFIKFILNVDYRLYNLNYTATKFFWGGEQSSRKITYGIARTKKLNTTGLQHKFIPKVEI
jgi:hypothetical protein